MTLVADATGAAVERYEFTPEGKREVFAGGHGARPDTLYEWRYGFREGRSDGGGLWNLGGVEHDYLTGGPLLEDPVAYSRDRNQHSAWTVRQSEVSLAGGWYWATQATRWAGLTALTVASGGSLGPGAFSLLRGLQFAGATAALGGAAGGAESWAQGGGFWPGVPGGAQAVMAVGSLLAPGFAALAPKWAFRGGLALNGVTTAYGVYDAEVVQGNNRLAWTRLGLGAAFGYLQLRAAGYRWGSGMLEADGSVRLGALPFPRRIFPWGQRLPLGRTKDFETFLKRNPTRAQLENWADHRSIELQHALGEGQRGRVIMSVGVVRDPKSGQYMVRVSSSEG